MNQTTSPFFSLRGCHAGAMVDIPWAHARLSADEFCRFVHAHEGPERVEACRRQFNDLNHFTLNQWREVVKSTSFEILDWQENPSEYAQTILDEFPEVTETLLDGVTQRDLVHEQIRTIMRLPE